MYLVILNKNLYLPLVSKCILILWLLLLPFKYNLLQAIFVQLNERVLWLEQNLPGAKFLLQNQRNRPQQGLCYSGVRRQRKGM